MNDDTKVISLRTTRGEFDRELVRNILESSGIFNSHEVDVAVELVDEWHRNGEKSGYHFVFAQVEELDAVATHRAGEIGFACFGPIACTKGRWDLHWIAVQKQDCGGGVGTQLLNYVEAVAAGFGAIRMYIDTSGRNEYAGTREFYEKNGYAVQAKLPDFYATDDDKIIYGKLLLRADDPEWDCTDYAHPAWWRGERYGTMMAVKKMTEVLDGKDDGKGVCGDDVGQETLRRRLLELVGQACRRCHSGEKVVNGICDKCYDPARDIWTRPDPGDPLATNPDYKWGICHKCHRAKEVCSLGICDECRGDPPPKK